MTRPIRIDAEAAAELEHAATWYEDQRDGLGKEFLEAVQNALDFIAEWPLAGVTVPGVSPRLQVRRVPVPRFPYHVIYIETGDTIRVLAFAHDHRMPGYWKSRGS